MRRLLLICTLTKASTTENQEMEYLTILFGKIRAKSDLLHIVLDCQVKVKFDSNQVRYKLPIKWLGFKIWSGYGQHREICYKCLGRYERVV